ncbi:MAG: hypothetical protein NXI21_00885 [Alphaproteobacteria bacterium]|nr:hypothetical protein [Alphaproteobacteria bacterium]
MRGESASRAFAQDGQAPRCFPGAIQALQAEEPPTAPTYFFAAKHYANPACADYQPEEAARLLSALLRSYGWGVHAAAYHDLLTQTPSATVDAARLNAVYWVLAISALTDNDEPNAVAALATLIGDPHPSSGAVAVLGRLAERTPEQRLEEALSSSTGGETLLSGAALRLCIRAAARANALRADPALACARLAYQVADRTPFAAHGENAVFFANGLVQREAASGNRNALELGAQRHANAGTKQGLEAAYQWLLAAEAAGGPSGSLMTSLRARISRDDQDALSILWADAGYLPPLPLPPR